MNRTHKYLSEYNAIVKENDDLYRSAAKKLKLSDCSFWILYSLRVINQEMTQSDVCAAIYAPKQTVNSALKNLALNGYIELLTGEDRRSKIIHLTEKGEVLAKETVDKIINIEYAAMDALSPAEQEIFISIFHKITDTMKKNIEDIAPLEENEKE